MPKQGPANAVALLASGLDIHAPPTAALDLLTNLLLDENWYSAPAEAAEVAARWLNRFLSGLRQQYSACSEAGRVCRFEFNSSSEYMIQGAAFIEGTESPSVKDAKDRRGRMDHYLGALENLSPLDFESLSRGILSLFGVEEPQLTPRSGDEGIDFYGRLPLEGLSRLSTLPNVYQRLAVWMVGQAKKYSATKVSTPDIRELVGSVDLAKGKAFGASRSAYEDLDIHVCDPVFYLFFTTGQISTDGWRLLERSGVIGMDGLMLAAFLADNNVGVINSTFAPEEFEAWLQQFRPA